MSKKLADRPPNVDKFIEKYGSEKITKLWLVREPFKIMTKCIIYILYFN